MQGAGLRVNARAGLSRGGCRGRGCGNLPCTSPFRASAPPSVHSRICSFTNCLRRCSGSGTPQAWHYQRRGVLSSGNPLSLSLLLGRKALVPKDLTNLLVCGGPSEASG